MDDVENPAEPNASWLPVQPRAEEHAPEPTPPRRHRRWPFALGIAVLITVLAAGAAVITKQESSLKATRDKVDALAAASSAQQKSLHGLDNSLLSARRALAGLSARLSTTSAELKAAQDRLRADEKQLNVTAQKLPPDLTALAAKVSPSVVLVTCTTPTGADSGTAFALDVPTPAGYATTLVTAEHVIDACLPAAAQGVISLGTGSQTAAAHIRGTDVNHDVAILDTTLRLPPLKPSSTAPVAGEFLMAVGNPLGIENNVTSGNVSHVYDTFFLDTAPISNGNSGGPVVDRSGNVVGIVDAGVTPDQQTPVVQNLNISLRLSTLCLSLLSGPQCDELH